MTRQTLLRRCAPGRDALGEPATEVDAPAAPWTERLAHRLRQDDTLAQFTRFLLVGGSTTLVYALLFIPFRGLGYLVAHLIATVASTLLANEMHRRLTFHAEDRVGWFTAQWEASTVAAGRILGTTSSRPADTQLPTGTWTRIGCSGWPIHVPWRRSLTAGGFSAPSTARRAGSITLSNVATSATRSRNPMRLIAVPYPRRPVTTPRSRPGLVRVHCRKFGAIRQW